jgi:hypothetical protein
MSDFRRTVMVSVGVNRQAVNKTHKVNLNIPDSAAPSIEAKDLVGKIDDLFSSKIVDLASSVSWTG